MTLALYLLNYLILNKFFLTQQVFQNFIIFLNQIIFMTCFSELISFFLKFYSIYNFI